MKLTYAGGWGGGGASCPRPSGANSLPGVPSANLRPCLRAEAEQGRVPSKEDHDVNVKFCFYSNLFLMTNYKIVGAKLVSTLGTSREGALAASAAHD
eukprot:scaffold198499_cov36-Tisochrysis_lutea.AAC.3